MAKSIIQITKLGAAQRQIDAAISMLFIGIDELAIVSVAGAATKLLSELNRDRGKDTLNKAFQDGLNVVLHRYLNDGLTDTGLRSWAASIISELSPSTIELIKSPDYMTVPIEDQLVSLDKAARGELWKRYLLPVNFLKHASVSSPKSNQSLSSEEINGVQHIVTALAHFIEIGLPLTNSMEVFKYYWLSKVPSDEQCLVRKTWM